MYNSANPGVVVEYIFLVVNGNKRTTELSRVEAEYIYNLTGGALRLLGSPCHDRFSSLLSFSLLSRFSENVQMGALADGPVHICAFAFKS
jgi:hypothetical protein